MNRLFLLLFGGLTFVAHAQVPDYVPTEGLVAWYPFNGNANDESGNGNDGLAVSVEPTQDRFGTEHAAYYFSGSGCTPRVDIDMNTSEITDEITISIWFNRQGNGCIGPRLFEAKPPSGDQGLGHMIIAWDNGWSHPQQWNHNLNASSGTAYDVFLPADSVNDVPNNSWGMLLYRNDGTSASYFQDGVLIAEMQNPENSTIHLPGDIAIGRMNHPAYDAFNGFIDDVGFWSRALTNEEIIALYNAELSMPGCTDPTACNYDAEATSDDGSCIPSGCMEPLACNYNALAECASEACDYTCCPGPGCCLEGTVWDAELGGCIPIEANCPEDLDFDGVVGVNDLMELLSAFGTDCAPAEDPETAEFTCGDPVNYHGYDYATVQIGEQCWFAENLRYLPEVSPVALGSEDDGMPHAYVYGYNGSSPEEAMLTANYSTYGALYNYEAIDEWNLCPEGWSNPTLAKWNALTSSHTAAECVSIEWFGNNQTGFNLLPGGDRDGVEGFNSFNNLGSAGLIWISENPPKHVGVVNQNWYEYENPTLPSFGFSIRCLKDQ